MNMTISIKHKFDASSKALEVLEEVDLNGKTMLITGIRLRIFSFLSLIVLWLGLLHWLFHTWLLVRLKIFARESIGDRNKEDRSFHFGLMTSLLLKKAEFLRTDLYFS